MKTFRLIAKGNQIALRICGNEESTICHFANSNFNSSTQTETIRIAFAKESTEVNIICEHSIMYLYCKQGCREKVKKLEDKQVSEESYPIKFNTLSNESFEQMLRLTQLRQTLTLIYLPVQI